jgi:hypothetical protein
MKSRKIRRLEFILNKIEDRDSKREGHAHLFWPTHEEKQHWLEVSMGGSHGRTSSSMAGQEELA